MATSEGLTNPIHLYVFETAIEAARREPPNPDNTLFLQFDAREMDLLTACLAAGMMLAPSDVIPDLKAIGERFIEAIDVQKLSEEQG